MSATLTKFPDGISAIDTALHRSGFDASHLIVDDGEAAFVDTGVNRSVPYLLDGLRQIGLSAEAVRYVLLTHIHLDHAGGAGTLMQHLPNATAVVHPRAERHMADPSRLVAGTKAVYGEEVFNRTYGDIPAIPQDRLITVDDGDVLPLGRRELEFIHTRGHADHHYCIVDRQAQSIFSGDTFGISYRDFDTANGAFIFPSSTPVHFDPEAAHASIDRIVGYDPQAIYLTHYSRVDEISRLANDLHNDLDAFTAIALAAEGIADGARVDAITRGLFSYLDSRLIRHGYTGDAKLRKELMNMDVVINAQGLDVWLNRRSAT